MKSLSMWIIGLAAFCYITLLAFVFIHPDAPDRSPSLNRLIFSSAIIFSGAITSAVLHYFGEKANLNFSPVKKVIFAVSGGYAVAFAALMYVSPKGEEVVKVVELREKSFTIPYDVDLTDVVVLGDGVSAEGIKKLGSERAYLKCRFAPDARIATIKFDVRANGIPYKATLVITRNDRAETLGLYVVN